MTDDVQVWGWRMPFLLSIVLVGISLYIRLRLQESPLFARLKASGQDLEARRSRDSFGSKAKWQTLLLVLLGAAAGQAVVWYTGQFYALSGCRTRRSARRHVRRHANIGSSPWRCSLGTPFFVVFGALSDRIGRKPIMMAGNLLAAVLHHPDLRAHAPVHAGRGNYNPVILIPCIFVLVILVTMVYGPIAAFLVESFPSKVRYTSRLAAVPHRQRLLRRLPAADRDRARSPPLPP